MKRIGWIGTVILALAGAATAAPVVLYQQDLNPANMGQYSNVGG